MDSIDILLAIVVVNGVVLVVQSARVVALYSSIYTLSPKDWKRQLPLHVWLMALSFGIYVAGTTYFLVASSMNHVLSRLLIYGAAGLIAQYALFNVLQYDRRRYSKVTNFRDPGDEV